MTSLAALGLANLLNSLPSLSISSGFSKVIKISSERISSYERGEKNLNGILRFYESGEFKVVAKIK